MAASPDQTTALLQNSFLQLQSNDPETMAKVAGSTAEGLQGLSPEDRRRRILHTIEEALDAVRREHESPGDQYHSRNPLAGLAQSLVQEFQDRALPQIQAYGEGNPLVWFPTGIDAFLECFRAKAPFRAATERSLIAMPGTCKVALLSDWGAENDHAARIGRLAIEQGADYVVHLGDIYYSGTDKECQRFLRRWPLRDAQDQPLAGRSFALNGNHEMYTQGRGYFDLVLPAFGQEASYFTLANDFWQIHGLDTAYVPFSLSGEAEDTRLSAQWNWLREHIRNSSGKRNILLTHNQPESAHIAEFTAAQKLKAEWWKLARELSTEAVFAWFFGHEHRCVIYDDEHTYFKARLIGNGSIPHPPQTETAPQVAANGATCTPARRFNRGRISESVAISTFCMLAFHDADCTATYINEDGSIFYAERLSGGKNAELPVSGLQSA